jgi:hypothetical protein
MITHITDETSMNLYFLNGSMVKKCNRNTEAAEEPGVHGVFFTLREPLLIRVFVVKKRNRAAAHNAPRCLLNRH